MPSWQARLMNGGVRLLIRRRHWGDDYDAIARRARLLFGATAAMRWLASRGVRIEPKVDGAVRGEWVVPPKAAAGVILYIHGGGYVSCSAVSHRPITAALARLSRLRVFSLDYRLAPEHRFPAALDDAVAAYRWLIEEVGVSPRTVAIGGDSAGGGLTLGTLLRARNSALPTPACAVCFSPWTDLAGTGESARRNDGLDPMFRPENLAPFAAAYLGGASPRDELASPVYADLGGLPPLLLQVGSTELLLDDARRVHEKVQRAGGASTLDIFEGVCHVWQMADGFVPEARVALRRAAAFIVAHVSGGVQAITSEHL